MSNATVKCRSLASLLWIAGAALLAAAPASAAENLLRYSGTASDPATGRFLYAEQHFVRQQSGQTAERVVLYTCRNGAPFARKQVNYTDVFAPDFELTDVRRGQREGLRRGAAGREVFYRESAQRSELSAPANAKAGWVADAGFDEFVRAKWDVLMRGGSERLEFLIPSRRSVHGFQIKHQRAEVVDGTPAQVFRLRLTGLLGLVLPGIDVWYSDAGRVLLRYEGLSNLQDPQGSQYKVRITFPLEKRVAGDEVGLASAKAAALQACG